MMQTDFGHLEEELKVGRPVATPTRGNSMQPLLYQDKTLAVLMPISGPLNRGDVALYKRDSGLFVLHRVVSVQDGKYCIRGDNCYYSELVRPDQILGVMTEVVRGGKTIRVTDFGYRCYAHFWLLSYPLRHTLDRLHRLPQILRRILHRNGGGQ